MFSFMVLTKDINRKNLKRAEKHFSFEFNSGSGKFISGFSFFYNMGITCGPNSIQFSLYEESISPSMKTLIEDYFLTAFVGEIEGIFTENDLKDYSFLDHIIEEDKVLT